jgi:UDP-N-acetylmuramate--alanine ligase
LSTLNSSLGIEKIREILKRRECKIHFVGILGAGMMPLAKLLHKSGVAVSGTDREWKDCREELVRCGISVTPYHTAQGLSCVSAVVYSLAIAIDAPEIQYATAHNIPLISRAELLGALMTDYKTRIGVSGSHGKSTTTAIIAHILSEEKPTVVSGANLVSGSNFEEGMGDLFIYEACEYKDSFLLTAPTVSVLLGVELDHTDYFKSQEDIERSFSAFADKSALSVLNIDDPGVKRIIKNLSSELITYGTAADATYRFERCAKGESGFCVYCNNSPLAYIKPRAIGNYMPQNMTAAIAVCHSLGVDIETIKERLQSFPGIKRRLELLGRIGEREVYYDYAHHPTEIVAAISTVRDLHGKCTVVFRSHTYSRTQSFWAGFVSALSLADYVVLVDVYAAREEEAGQKDACQMAREIGEKAKYMDACEVFPYIKNNTEGAVMLMGAGNIDGIKKDFERNIE